MPAWLAEFMREMRRHNFSDAIAQWFELGKEPNQRDTIAARCSGPR